MNISRGSNIGMLSNGRYYYPSTIQQILSNKHMLTSIRYFHRKSVTNPSSIQLMRRGVMSYTGELSNKYRFADHDLQMTDQVTGGVFDDFNEYNYDEDRHTHGFSHVFAYHNKKCTPRDNHITEILKTCANEAIMIDYETLKDTLEDDIGEYC